MGRYHGFSWPVLCLKVQKCSHEKSVINQKSDYSKFWSRGKFFAPDRSWELDIPFIIHSKTSIWEVFLALLGYLGLPIDCVTKDILITKGWFSILCKGLKGKWLISQTWQPTIRSDLKNNPSSENVNWQYWYNKVSYHLSSPSSKTFEPFQKFSRFLIGIYSWTLAFIL